MNYNIEDKSVGYLGIESQCAESRKLIPHVYWCKVYHKPMIRKCLMSYWYSHEKCVLKKSKTLVGDNSQAEELLRVSLDAKNSRPITEEEYNELVSKDMYSFLE